MAVRADLDAFHAARLAIRGDLVRESLSRELAPEGELSAAEIAFLVGSASPEERADWIVALVREAVRSYQAGLSHRGLDSLGLSRVLHTTGSVLLKIGAGEIARALAAGLTEPEKDSLGEMGAPFKGASKIAGWAGDLKEAAFRHLGRTIVYRGGREPAPPRNILRSDEIVWGRAPARLDLGGGWTDTPPYSLERGGCVINAAVTLNGQAPIQAYARVIEKREIRINSIDHSTRVVVRTLDGLMDYRKPGSQFALAKAALALAGFAPEAAAWPAQGSGRSTGCCVFSGAGSS